ncbi:ABC transporter permease subunit [candidate division WOR-3 bacterium]|nr:ABC transporter permease subunit [candidate division WOR-3 bacterium]
MHRVIAILENTFKESIRQKILLLLVVFAILLIGISLFMEPFALGEAPKIMRDFGLAAASLFGILTTIIIGSTLIRKDVEKKTIYTVLSKPVKRSEVILGKFLGLSALVTLLVLAMLMMQQLVIFAYEGAFDPRLLIALPFTIIEVMVLLGILLLFSSFSSTTMTSIMGVIFFVVGHAMPDLKLFADQASVVLLKYVTYGFYYVLPNLENFNLRIELAYGLPLYADQILFSMCYGVMYITFLLYLTTLVFEGREFK